VEEEDVLAIGEAIRGAGLWVLQQFVAPHSLEEKYREMEPQSVRKLHEFVKIAEKYAENVMLRGV
jgi:hypothetical protein